MGQLGSPLGGAIPLRGKRQQAQGHTQTKTAACFPTTPTLLQHRIISIRTPGKQPEFIAATGALSDRLADPALGRETLYLGCDMARLNDLPGPTESIEARKSGL